ncbi:MAG: hybrid sensor histidine kinase/response regulator [Nitrospirae bacterium]|nr:MAG: hybrid sensor histidine kinase/response regulator [Nitrospirota bacterium]
MEPQKAIRIDNVAQHSRACGCPPGHPVMHTLLLAPIADQDHTFGKVYLCNKEGHMPFTDEDELFVLSFSRSLALVLGHARAVEERQQAMERQAYLEAQLRQTQKLEALGRLAGGIAHDFNNLLTVIEGYTELALLRQADLTQQLQHQLAEIKKASTRGARLVQQLLAFSRRQRTAPQMLDLNQLVANIVPMLRCLMGDDVELHLELDPSLPPITIDPGQCEQMVVNLMVNARDAMPTGGQVIIRTVSRSVETPLTHRYGVVNPGSYVMLEVCDSGCGMTEEVKAHLFEPFFTTKEVGKGTGLGLSTVYSIVQQCGGHILFESAPGAGTTFQVLFPHHSHADESTASPASQPRQPQSDQATETILLVEDESPLRQLLAEILRKKGYTVLEAESPVHALTLAKAANHPIHLLLTDMIMPHMNGVALATAIAERHPETKVLYMSGHPDPGTRIPTIPQTVVWLQKPFEPEELTRHIRRLLDTPGEARDGPSIPDKRADGE